MRTRVKFCGITRAEDALAAVELGVDALGFVFAASSPRRTESDKVAEIVKQLPPLVSKVGLFVDEDIDTVVRVARASGIDTLQFHGEEIPEYCIRASTLAGMPYIKAIRMRAGIDLLAQCAAYGHASALLLDTYHVGLAGGTGEIFDWRLIPEALPKPVVLAGGMSIDNVVSAIRSVHPYAVDVSSGIEMHKGLKDRDKMRRFMYEVNTVD